MYTEVIATCVECGKDIKKVVLEGSDISEFLCPKCSMGELIMDSEE